MVIHWLDEFTHCTICSLLIARMHAVQFRFPAIKSFLYYYDVVYRQASALALNLHPDKYG